jgi:4-hydroxy-2-oxoheptanedioate aldolase
MTQPPLKQLWSAGTPSFGAWSTLDDPVALELMGRAGFDFVTVDLQHGYASAASLPRLLPVLRATPARAFVRVAWNSPDQIMRALDCGAEAVVVPMVSTVAEAEAAAAACRYAPAGSRSWGPILANAAHSAIEPAAGDRIATCVVMIETREGLENAADIARVDGVDALYVGPNDLSLGLGLDRRSFHEAEELHAAIAQIIEAGAQAGTPVGVDCMSTADAHYWVGNGAAFTMSASDGLLLRRIADEVGAELHA